ncbi:MAG TPA: hypothetical protein VGH65_06505, partial [Verrucomicrobiaceae bacterium]
MLPRLMGPIILAWCALLAFPVSARAQIPPPKPVAAPLPAAAAPKRSPLATKPDWSRLEAFSGVMSREEFEAAFATFYSDGTNVATKWKLEPGKVIIETAPGQAPVEIAFRDPAAADKSVPHYWHAPRELPPLQPNDPPLKGWHVALDPGHIGGEYAKMEERWLSMTPESAIMEGSLTAQLAWIIKPRLEALGARVSLVRPYNNPVSTINLDSLRGTAREILKDAGISHPRETY